MRNEIVRWKPFLARYISYDGSKEVTVTFRCPHCGSRSCDRRTKRTHNRPDDRHYFQGSFRCSECGAEYDRKGDSFNYYSECFITNRAEIVIQQTLF